MFCMGYRKTKLSLCLFCFTFITKTKQNIYIKLQIPHPGGGTTLLHVVFRAIITTCVDLISLLSTIHTFGVYTLISLTVSYACCVMRNKCLIFSCCNIQKLRYKSMSEVVNNA